MKKMFWLLLLMPAWAVAQKQLINDPNAQERTVTGPFKAIQISNAFDCILSQGEEVGVAVSAATAELRDHIRVNVENGVLTVKFVEPEQFWKYLSSKKLKVYISFKTLERLSVSGACEVLVNGDLNANDLELHFSGASSFKGNIFSKKLTVNIDGASGVQINKGTADQVLVEASGASKFRGYGLEARLADASASGASDIMLTVKEALKVKASGASKVQYKGDAVISEIRTSGASSVNRRD